jgi:frataxin
MIDKSEYLQIIDDLLRTLEGKYEDSLAFEEVNLNGGVLTLELNNGSVFVINKHEPTQELWLSSPLSGAHHFKYIETSWQSKAGEFFAILYEELAKFGV